jgi:hypothetical protein
MLVVVDDDDDDDDVGDEVTVVVVVSWSWGVHISVHGNCSGDNITAPAVITVVPRFVGAVESIATDALLLPLLGDDSNLDSTTVTDDDGVSITNVAAAAINGADGELL